MTEDEMMELGARAETLLRDANLQLFSAAFEQSVANQMMATRPNETEVRERVFGELIGHRAFISFLADAVDQAQKLTAKNGPVQDIEDYDDPEVHNIY